MNWWLVFAVFLYLLSALLLIAEVFVPSGGLISICAFACIGGGILIFFSYSAAMGWFGVLLAVVVIPSALVVAYKILPRTRFGKSVTLLPSERKPGEAIANGKSLQELLNAKGSVLTPLRPVGMCDFSGKKVECVAESGYVEKGRKVKVIRVQSSQVTVREIEKS